MYNAGSSTNVTGFHSPGQLDWLQYSPGLFYCNYTNEELAELSACGYLNLSIEISIEIKDSGCTYQALALQRFLTNESTVTPNSTLAGSYFYVAADSDYSSTSFQTRKLCCSISTSALLNSSTAFRLAFGTLASSNNMMWTHGAVSVKFTPSKTSQSVHGTGGWYEIIFK